MAVSEALLDAVRRTMGVRPDSGTRCSTCGTFLDAPRVNPLTGTMARKCAVCSEWHPVVGRRSEYAE